VENACWPPQAIRKNAGPGRRDLLIFRGPSVYRPRRAAREVLVAPNSKRHEFSVACPPRARSCKQATPEWSGSNHAPGTVECPLRPPGTVQTPTTETTSKTPALDLIETDQVLSEHTKAPRTSISLEVVQSNGWRLLTPLLREDPSKTRSTKSGRNSLPRHDQLRAKISVRRQPGLRYHQISFYSSRTAQGKKLATRPRLLIHHQDS